MVPQNKEVLKLKNIEFENKSESEIIKAIQENKEIKIYKNLKKELSLVSEDTLIKVDILALSKLLSNCYQMDITSMKSLY